MIDRDVVEKIIRGGRQRTVSLEEAFSWNT